MADINLPNPYLSSHPQLFDMFPELRKTYTFQPSGTGLPDISNIFPSRSTGTSSGRSIWDIMSNAPSEVRTTNLEEALQGSTIGRPSQSATTDRSLSPFRIIPQKKPKLPTDIETKFTGSPFTYRLPGEGSTSAIPDYISKALSYLPAHDKTLEEKLRPIRESPTYPVTSFGLYPESPLAETTRRMIEQKAFPESFYDYLTLRFPSTSGEIYKRYRLGDVPPIGETPAPPSAPAARQPSVAPPITEQPAPAPPSAPAARQPSVAPPITEQPAPAPSTAPTTEPPKAPPITEQPAPAPSTAPAAKQPSVAPPITEQPAPSTSPTTEPPKAPPPKAPSRPSSVVGIPAPDNVRSSFRLVPLFRGRGNLGTDNKVIIGDTTFSLSSASLNSPIWDEKALYYLSSAHSPNFKDVTKLFTAPNDLRRWFISLETKASGGQERLPAYDYIDFMLQKIDMFDRVFEFFGDRRLEVEIYHRPVYPDYYCNFAQDPSNYDGVVDSRGRVRLSALLRAQTELYSNPNYMDNYPHLLAALTAAYIANSPYKKEVDYDIHREAHYRARVDLLHLDPLDLEYFERKARNGISQALVVDPTSGKVGVPSKAVYDLGSLLAAEIRDRQVEFYNNFHASLSNATDETVAEYYKSFLNRLLPQRFNFQNAEPFITFETVDSLASRQAQFKVVSRKISNILNSKLDFIQGLSDDALTYRDLVDLLHAIPETYRTYQRGWFYKLDGERLSSAVSSKVGNDVEAEIIVDFTTNRKKAVYNAYSDLVYFLSSKNTSVMDRLLAYDAIHLLVHELIVNHATVFVPTK